MRQGDQVLAFDENNPQGTPVQRQVEEVFVKTAILLRVLTVRDDAGREQTLKTTDEHPFYVPSTGWVEASRLFPQMYSASVTRESTL